VAAGSHASNAPFTIKHSTGSATVLVNQRLNGGQWMLLGTYTFSAGTAGTVTLTDKANGTVIADAVKLVPTGGGTTQEALRYLHTDHLGTPRLATDAAQQVLWRWDGNAFGDSAPNQDPDGDGTLTTVNLRYPGQYFDGETGLHYNWNRYYDPKTGRYITSDPMSVGAHVQKWMASLGKGSIDSPPLELNSYAYVVNNPLRWIDPTGLEVLICSKAWTPHTFLCVDGTCSGKAPSGNPFFSPGVIRDDAENQSKASCSPVPNKCGKSFEDCVTTRLLKRGPSGDLYNWTGANCGEWVKEVITTCRAQCSQSQ
jgi:RHS repeat-associated protein